MRKEIRNQIVSSNFYSAVQLLENRDQKRIFLVLLVQIFMGLLDLIGVITVGILGSLAVTGIQSKKPSGLVAKFLENLNLSSISLQSQVAIIGFFAVAILLGKTIFSIIFTRRMLFFLSFKGGVISKNMVEKLLSLPLAKIQIRTTQEILYSVTSGVTSLMLNVIGAAVTMVSDSALLVILIIGLFLVDPVMCLIMSLLFLSLSVTMYSLLNKKARLLGIQNTELIIESNEKILEVIGSYREAVIRNRRAYYSEIIGDIRKKHSSVSAENAFIPFISKYVVESTVVVFAFIICAFQFLINDAIHAIAILTIFMAAGSRIAPASLRIQQSAITIKTYLGVSKPTLDLARDLKNAYPRSKSPSNPDFIHLGFTPEVIVRNATFQYDNSTNFGVRNFNLNIAPGNLVAIVGTTGSGKTTIADLILGIHEVTNGEIIISGEKPMDAIVKWPGALAYVPQDTMITNGNIRDNVALGFNPENIDDTQVWEAIESAQLGDYVRELPLQLLSQVGERGTKLSGGQRQRLGIARALFTKPKLLVLDEATSALDAETEKQVARAIAELHGNVTLIIIAHRLSTVQKADKVVYLNNGEILAEGSFDFVRKSVSNFDEQAKLMGL